MQQKLSAARRLRGTIQVPGDKSISHRAVLFNALAEGNAEITGFLPGADCLSSIACLRQMGVVIEQSGDAVRVYGRGLRGLREPADVLDCGNSGTTLRLLAGLLAGQPFLSVLSGDASLRSRPQRRIVGPLRALGAQIDGRSNGDLAPLVIRGATLHGGAYELPIASAQVKSALLLAGLTGDAPMRLTGKIASRDHTERMLRAFGAQVDVTDDGGQRRVSLPGGQQLRGAQVQVPGDPSSAAFPLVAALVVPGSEVTVQGMLLNPLRIGLLDTLGDMGADLSVTNVREEGGETVADVTARHSALTGVDVPPERAPSMIDEYPILAATAAFADGRTVMRGVAEMRVKESDRIRLMVDGLRACGVAVEEEPEGFVVTGGPVPGGTTVRTAHDHRIAMSHLVLGLASVAPVTVDEPDMIATSFPGFLAMMQGLGGQVG